MGRVDPGSQFSSAHVVYGCCPTCGKKVADDLSLDVADN